MQNYQHAVVHRSPSLTVDVPECVFTEPYLILLLFLTVTSSPRPYGVKAQQVTEHHLDAQTSHIIKQSAYSEVSRAYLMCSKKCSSLPPVTAASSLLRGDVSKQLEETASAEAEDQGVSILFWTKASVGRKNAGRLLGEGNLNSLSVKVSKSISSEGCKCQHY